MPTDTATPPKQGSSARRRLRPKLEDCRAQNIVAGKVVQCLTKGAPFCCYTRPFGTIRLCVAPERTEIIARTEVEEKKNDR